jgi:hypothetical protein
MTSDKWVGGEWGSSLKKVILLFILSLICRVPQISVLAGALRRSPVQMAICAGSRVLAVASTRQHKPLLAASTNHFLV